MSSPCTDLRKPLDENGVAMLKYSQFIGELRALLERGKTLYDLDGRHEDPGFQRWRHEVTDLIKRIEHEGYDTNCHIAERLFDVEYGSYKGNPTPGRIAAYNLDLQDTLNELEIIIGRFDK